MAMISGKEFIDLLDDYFAGSQSNETKEEFNRLMAVCPDCVEYLRSYEECTRTCREQAEISETALSPAEAPEELIRAILAPRNK